MRRIGISLKLFCTVGLLIVFQFTALWSIQVEKGKPNNQASTRDVLYEMKFKIENQIDKDHYWKTYLADLLNRVDGIEYIGMTHDSQIIKIGYIPAIINMAKLHSILEESLKTSLKESTHSKATELDYPDKSGFESVLPDTNFSDVYFKSLTNQEAKTNLKNHIETMKLDGIDIEKCYVIKVEFKAGAFVNSGDDWPMKTRLVDENGEHIKPVSWFTVPGEKNELREPNLSGLLLFPKVPLLKLGLTLRFLRANGDGYDSYIIDTP